MASAKTESRTTFTIGTRKSELAVVQSQIVRDSLAKRYAGYDFPMEKMSTTGDKILDTALSKIGEKALFTKELEIALEDGKVDLVVHSLKDLPTTLPAGMHLAAILERDDPNDALVLSPEHKDQSLDTLPKGSVIGTSSLRRVAQLKRRYPHLEFESVRGNLNTRLAKLDDPNTAYVGIILAVAGLRRLGKEGRISKILEPSETLHAVSQGALGVECRDDDEECKALLKGLNHRETRLCCLSERALMRELEGGCSVPIGVNTHLEENGKLTLRGLVANTDGTDVVEHEAHVILQGFPKGDDTEQESAAERLGVDVAIKLKEMGADAILKSLRPVELPSNPPTRPNVA